MPLPAICLILATLLPLVAFGILLSIGRRVGNPLAGWVGTAFITLSFLCSIAALVTWLNGGHYDAGDWGKDRLPIVRSLQWIPIGSSALPNGISQDHPGYLDLGLYIDSLTISMFLMITMVAAAVHFFSIGYMSEDKDYPRYFTYLSLFCFSMLGLVIGGTLIHIFVFWELVGLCSYLLIGFWYESRSTTNAAIKAFIVNRIGDVGFLIGLGVLFYHMGNASLPDLWTYLADASSGHAVTLPGSVFTGGALTLAGLGLFCGAIGKSAQFPLHVWLPDAMEGPTPGSALIHAATMVAAGVYLVGRIFPILTPNAKLVIAIVGLVTLTMAALIALGQTDIKRLLAYSTISQLGYMMLALGVGSWVGGLFHLITHAFFKALLFLGAGSVIRAARHEQEMGEFGGLLKQIPWTAATFGVAVLAISGTPLLSGSYSKAMILSHAGAFATLGRLTGHSIAYTAFWILPTLVAYLTAFYMMRCWMLSFWGKPRNQELFDQARETPVMWAPLVVLAVMSVISGKWLGVQQLLESSVRETQAICADVQARDDYFKGHPSRVVMNRIWVTDPNVLSNLSADASLQTTPGRANVALLRGERLEHVWAYWAFAVGLLAAFLVYMRGPGLARTLTAIPPISWIRSWLYHRMFFDELYFSVFVGVVGGISTAIGWFDRVLVDGVVNLCAVVVRTLSSIAGATDHYVVDGAVDGVATLTQQLSSAVRTPQNGRVRVYVAVLMVAVVLGMSAAIIVVLSS